MVETLVKSTPAPGQTFAKRWAIYAALGAPQVNLETWRLWVRGLVERELTFSFEELSKMPQAKHVRSFHCVTGWSIADVEWEGISLKGLMEMAKPKPEAKWVMFHCAEGYTAPVPLEDALVDDAIVAFKLSGKPLRVEQGYPARPFIPHLYGWKSAKWLTGIELIPEYVDGYWEMFNYHQRADVWEEERFKGKWGKHTRHRGLGTLPV